MNEPAGAAPDLNQPELNQPEPNQPEPRLPEPRLPGLNRHRERGRAERAALDAVLDAIPYGTLSAVVDGRPWVVPMLFARDGDHIILHGSTGAGALRHVAAGAPAALCVIILDAVVVAGSTFNSSANYRSAVVHGELTALTGDEKWNALERISEQVIPGRTGEVRQMSSKELAATLAMTMPIVDGRWVVKTRVGGPGDEEQGEGVWEGIVPVRLAFGEPAPTSWSRDLPVPASVKRLSADGWPGYDQPAD